MVGIAAGLATMGFVAFTSTFACFAAKRATDQIRVMVAQPELPVIIMGAYSGMLAGKTGKTHQAIQDAAIYPGHAQHDGHLSGRRCGGAQGGVRGGRVRQAHLSAPHRDPSPVIFADDYDFRIGKATRDARRHRRQHHHHRHHAAAGIAGSRRSAEGGDQAHVLHVPTLKPLDEEAIIAAAQKTGLVVTAEEHTIIGGLGGAVAETLGEHAPTLMRRVGVKDVFGESAPNDELLVKYGLTAKDIAEAARGLCAASKTRT